MNPIEDLKRYMVGLAEGRQYVGGKLLDNIFSCLGTPIYIVGSTPIHLLLTKGNLSEYRTNLPDIDIICSRINEAELAQYRNHEASRKLKNLKYDGSYTNNDHKDKIGYKFVSKVGNFKFDIWTFNDCLATNFDITDESPCIERFVKNVHFNVEAIAFDINSNELIDFGFFKGVEDQVVRSVNPYLRKEKIKERLDKKKYFLQKYGFRISRRLKRLCEMTVKDKEYTTSKPIVVSRY